MTTPTLSSKNKKTASPEATPEPLAPTLAATAGPPKLRRRPLLAVVAAGLVVVGGLGGVWAWSSAASTVEVVATRAAVERGGVIAAEDLMVVRVNPDPALLVVPAAQLDILVGQRAATDLLAGSLLGPGQVSTMLPPPAGSSVVGIALETGLLPAEPLRSGDRVRLVQTPGAQGDYTDTPVALDAEVLAVSLVGERTVVDVLVPSQLAPEVMARAATGKVGLVLDARER